MTDEEFEKLLNIVKPLAEMMYRATAIVGILYLLEQKPTQLPEITEDENLS